MQRWLFSFLSGVLVIAAGGSGAFARQATPDTSPTGDAALPPLVWQLAEAVLADGTVYTPDDPSLYTIQFLPDGRFSGRADCNQVGGSYTVDGVALTLSDMMMTLVGCPPGSLGEEFASWLGTVVSYELLDEALVLSLDDGGALRFVPALTDVVWNWQRLLSGNDTTVVPENPDQYTLRFQDDGTVLIQADCNRGGGQYTVDGSTIDIERIALTKMACPAGSLADEFVVHLEAVTSFTFADGQLSLALPMDGGLLLFTGHEAPPPATPIAATPVHD